MTAKLPEFQWILDKVPREILWLAGILCASVPLAMLIWYFRGSFPLLAEDWQRVLPVPLYRKVLLYLLVAGGCYLGRLAAKVVSTMKQPA